MSKTYEKSNEALAILAQRGCEVVREKARDLLLRRNEGLIYDKALTYWNYVIGSDIDRSLTLDDLVQLGRIKFCEALASISWSAPTTASRPVFPIWFIRPRASTSA